MSVENRNALVYAIIAAVIAVAGAVNAALLAGKVPGFGPGGPVEWLVPILVAPLAVIVPFGGLWLAANRPRLGSAKLAAEVDAKRATGASRRELTVIAPDDVAPSRDPLVAEVAAEVARLRAEGYATDELIVVPRQDLAAMSPSQRRVLADR